MLEQHVKVNTLSLQATHQIGYSHVELSLKTEITGKAHKGSFKEMSTSIYDLRITKIHPRAKKHFVHNGYNRSPKPRACFGCPYLQILMSVFLCLSKHRDNNRKKTNNPY